MSPRTRSLKAMSFPSRPITVATVMAGLLAAAMLSGCGSSARDHHARVRGSVIEAKPGDGELVASVMWTGESFASENRQVRVASLAPGRDVSDE
ncbi:MAG: hypothetical protein KF787_00160 [Phycisphaeraceae bacterium]|nr:hypothetical protein [Phycisphaerae bacterium]MBX3391038.1 hypothetical protein [Phycisphaeraceae bacterium]HRJ49781.1 hypothetical protein [Phycisphaerales bacterium]